MSNLSYSEYLSRFKTLSTQKVREHVSLNTCLDSQTRLICPSLEYTDLDRSERDDIFKEFLKTYNKKYSLRLVFFTGKKKDSDRNLVLIFEEAVKLSEYIADQEKANLQVLTIREVKYVFRKLAKSLGFLHSLDLAHGIVKETDIWLDSSKNVKLLKYPKMLTALEVIKEEAKLSTEAATKSLLMTQPPEWKSLLESASIQQLQKADCFNLGLLIIRLIDPTLIIQEANIQSIASKVIRILDALSPVVDQEFAGLLTSCLEENPDHRPDLRSSLNWEAHKHVTSAISLGEFEKDIPEDEEEEVSEYSRQPDPSDESRRKPNRQLDSAEDSNMKILNSYLGHYKSASPIKQLVSSNIMNFKLPQNIYREAREAVDLVKEKKDRIASKSSKTPQKKVKNPDSPESPPSKQSFDAATLKRLKLKCMEALETSIFAQLPSDARLERSLGETFFNIKTLPSGKNVGFIQYPNQSIYFGFVENLSKSDLGLLFLENGDVYHGEFRKGKIFGRGTYLYTSGDVLEGEWKNEVLHGDCRLFDYGSGRHLLCRFIDGGMVDQSECSVSTPVNNINIGEFYSKFFMNTQLVQTLTHEYLLPGYRNPVRRGKSDEDEVWKRTVNPKDLDDFFKKENKDREFYREEYRDWLQKDTDKRTLGGAAIQEGKAQRANLRKLNVDQSDSKPKRSVDQSEAGDFVGKGLKSIENELERLSHLKETLSKKYGKERRSDSISRERENPKHFEISAKNQEPANRFKSSTPNKKGYSETENQILFNFANKNGNRLRNVLDEIIQDSEPATSPKKETHKAKRTTPRKHSSGIPSALLRRTIRVVDDFKEPGAKPLNTKSSPVFYTPDHTGFAQILFNDGDRFYGEFERGLASGNGVFYSAEGWILHGRWSKGLILEALSSPL